MKKIFFVLLVFVLLIFAFYKYVIYNYLPLNCTEISTDFGKLYYDDSQEDQMEVSILEIEKRYEFIRKTYNLREKKVNVNYHIQGGKKSPINNNRSFYNGLTNSIVYFESTEFSVPIIHEYIHSQIGHFSEHWFREGFTVYLYLKAVSHSDEVSATNTLDYQNYQKLHCGDERILCVEKLNSDFSKDYVLKLFNDEIKLNTRKKNNDFYTLSAIFCEYLSNKMGEEVLLSIIRERKWYQFSIEKILRKKDMDILELRNDWISANFN